MIIDLSGRNVAIDQGNSISLDISELPSGIYFLKVNSDENCSIKKIVKQ
ncbi:MAG: T9SS type A sorting domain-containing protein [Bacteroidetes bacterium]|nr:T9SS type A sorting domain-containing protein [Bacteroidota bacterium]